MGSGEAEAQEQRQVMECSEIEELAGAFALGALPPDQMQQVRQHLQTCLAHPDLAELQQAASALLWAAPEMEPPPALRRRILAAARQQARPSLQTRGIGRWLPALGPYRLAAALAMLALALLGWNLSLLLGGSQGGGQAVVYQVESGGAHGRLVYMPHDKMAVLVLEGLPSLPADKTYQVWAIRGSQRVSMGLLQVSGPQPVSASMAMDISTVDAVAITIEPAGGSPSPTSPPVLQIRF
jgi:anti-sigma-K factor RskA